MPCRRARIWPRWFDRRPPHRTRPTHGGDGQYIGEGETVALDNLTDDDVERMGEARPVDDEGVELTTLAARVDPER